MGLSTICAWCRKPLLDPEHAKKHVLTVCLEAPAADLYRALVVFARWPLSQQQETAPDDQPVLLGGPGADDPDGLRFVVTVGHVRQARAAIAKAEGRAS